MNKLKFFIILMACVSAAGLLGYFMIDDDSAGYGSVESSFSDVGDLEAGRGAASGHDNAVSKRTAQIENDILDFKSAIQRGASSEQRIEMARNLNVAYFDSRSESVQEKISNALTDALNEEQDLQVARAIAFSHSRLPFDENTLPNLRNAYRRQVLSIDDYFGELAHIYPYAPDKFRGEIVKEITESNSRYAVDVIAGVIAADNNMKISREEAADFYRFLTRNEPVFSGPLDGFGYFEAILYVDWLRATSRLQSAKDGMNMERFIGIKLLHPDTDPRASVAFLISIYAKTLDGSQRAELQWDAVKARAQELMRQYPDAPGLQEIGKDMAQ